MDIDKLEMDLEGVCENYRKKIIKRRDLRRVLYETINRYV